MNGDLPRLDSIVQYWHDTRFEWSDGNPIYLGKSPEHNKATDEDGWKIWKFIWSGSDLILRQGPMHGTWDDRASLDWYETSMVTEAGQDILTEDGLEILTEDSR